ncbi:cytochrome P450 [Lentzea tibetensis]|uniref:Cytochrome P450 n=1 Tax=Lentzea tibetensis TaxID=2591470 RepID=A0A563ET69_9PSEU|nr:cytochrome P450 [Lentzea tibetensis]TWP50853.1 cytochrome P450 [Lentzea tibetensis]
MKLLNRAFMHDPYPSLAEMRESCAAVPVENGGFRMWVLTRYEDARAVLADPSLHRDLVKHRHEVVKQNLVNGERKPKLPRELRRSMLDQDGEDHRRLRGLVSGFFSPSRLKAARPRVEEVARGLLDAIPSGEVDLIEAYARPLPVILQSELLGVPVDAQDRFPLWETAILTAPTKEEVEDAGRQLHAFAREIIELKRAEPADDLFTTLVRAGDEGVLAEMEVISMITLLLIAGLEPTSVIGSGVLTLVQHPEQLARLRADRSLLPGTIDEVLRYETPFRMLTPRYLDHPLELADVTIPAGELILVSTGAANRDPAKYAEPDRFDVARCPKGHLGFSHGNHRCLGAELGRMQTTVALDVLLDTFPSIELAVAAEDVRWRPGMFMRRLDTLPVKLSRD